jgi:PAS domain S-box-containing protein
MKDNSEENELVLQLERIRELEGSMAELNKTLEAVKQSEERYRHIVEDQTEFVCRFRPGGIITFANPALHRLTGQEQESLVGQSFFSLISSPDREIVESEIASLNVKKNVSTTEHRVLMPDCSEHRYQWTIRAVFSKSGRFIEYQSTGRDITNLRETEEALRRSEESYRNLIENVSDGVYKLNAKGYFTFINPISMQRMGVSEKDYQSCHYLDFVIPEHHEKVGGQFERVMKGQETQPYELQYRNREGQLRTVEVKSKPIFKNRKVVGLLGISRDISIRKQAEEMILNAKNRLEQMVETRTKELEDKTEQLGLRTRNLEEMNTALNVLLNKIENDKKELENNIRANLQESLFPHLENLKNSNLGEAQRACVTVMEETVNTIATPFIKNLRLKHSNLSSKEIQVSSLIKEGRTTKEIATILNVSVKDVEFHRYNIRKKLNLTRKKTSLSAYLSQLFDH